MGDIAELRGLIVVASFLVCFSVLTTAIPSAFFVQNPEYRQATVPEYFEAIDVTIYAVTWNYTLDGTDATLHYGVYIHTENIGGHEIDIIYPPANTSHTFLLDFNHADYWWIFRTGSHDMEIYWQGSSLGDTLDKSEAEDCYEADDLTFTVQCEHTAFSLFIAFNETRYASVTDAFNHNDLSKCHKCIQQLIFL